MNSRACPLADPSRYIPTTARLVLIAGLLVGTYWWTFQWMVARWEAPGSYYSHGWLVPLVSGYILWTKRRELKSIRPQASAGGLVLFAGALLLHLVGLAWRIGFVSGLSLLLSLGALVWYVAGRRALRVVAFPLAFLVFMVPIPTVTIQNISFQMKMLAASMAMKVIEVLGVVAVQEGSFLTLVSGEQIVVDDVCSGLRYLISLLAFAAVYAYFSPLKARGRLLLLAGSVPLALGANVSRIVLMTLVAERWGVAASQTGPIHTGLGFAVFVVAFVLLVAAESALLPLLGKADRRRRRTGTTGDEPVDATRAADSEKPSGVSRRLTVAVGILAAVTATSLYLVWPRARIEYSEFAARIPLDLGGWKGQELGFDQRTLDVLGTTDVTSRKYQKDGEPDVDFSVIYARFTRRATHPPEICMKGSGWLVASQRDRELGLGTDSHRRSLVVRELELRKDGQNHLLFYFYKSRKRYTASYWQQQIRVTLSRLRDPNASDALIRVITPVAGGRWEEARSRLTGFLADIIPHVDEALP